MKNRLILCTLALLLTAGMFAQKKSLFSGSITSINHLYHTDRAINFIRPVNPFATNTITQLNYSFSDFTAGLQYEAYLPPLSGYPYQLEGNKITGRYFRYSKESLDVTVGSFYEQFGNGIIYRSYENRELGINSSTDGLKVIFRPLPYLRITALYGAQRRFLEVNKNYMKGVDAQLFVDSLLGSSLSVRLGAGFISRYDKYTGSEDGIPENVNAASIRASFNFKNSELSAEYANKSADPSRLNHYSGHTGEALLINGNYSRNRFGFFFSARFLKSMDFSNDRDYEDIHNSVNFLPANTKQHSYMLAGIYPYSTRTENEFSFQGEISYSIKKGSRTGGRYGTGIRVNFSHVRDLDQKGGEQERSLLSVGENLYFQDFNIELSRKFSNLFRGKFTYINLQYNKELIEAPVYEMVKSNIFIADLHFRFSEKVSLRGELQQLFTKQDEGNWTALLAELGIAPHLSFFVSEMINNRGGVEGGYYNVGAGYKTNRFRISLGFGRQREGFICSGGICQRVPSYKGINLRMDVNF
jgi:hypothetical protein